MPAVTRPLAVAAVLLALAGFGTAWAEDPARIELTLKDHKFTPAEIHVTAGKPTILIVKNQDATAEEFDSSDLKVEKVITGGQQGTIRLRPLTQGRYAFEGEYHADTAQGVVVAE
jgi:hypothetical protein